MLTKRATCNACNSGNAVDEALIQALAPFAVILDVPRDRTKHPELSLKDEEQGPMYSIAPRRPPRLAPQFVAPPVKEPPDTEGLSRLTFQVVAVSEDEARGFVRQRCMQSKRVHVVREEFSASTEPGGPFTVTLVNGASLTTPDSLRGVTKIAASYARAMGVRLPAGSPALKFLRGHAEPARAIGVPSRDVVTFPGVQHLPLHHALFLKRDVGGPLIAHVVLFSIFEFVVVLDEEASAEPPLNHGYLWSVSAGQPVIFNYLWAESSQAIAAHCGTFVQSGPRAELRGAWPRHYINNPRELCRERSVSAAGREYFIRKDQRASEEDALSAARERAAAIFARFGLTLEEFEMTVTQKQSA